MGGKLMKASELNELVGLMETCESVISKVTYLWHKDRNPLTEKERHSNEGITFGSKLYAVSQDIPSMSEVLKFIQMAREPEIWGDYLDKANMYLPEGEDFSNSIYPPKKTRSKTNDKIKNTNNHRT